MIKKRKNRKPTETDWVALRMLYLVLCSEPSSALIEDVDRTVYYFQKKLGDYFYPSMSKIVAEHCRLGTFENPAIAIGRRLDKSINYQEEINWPNAEDINNGWKPVP